MKKLKHLIMLLLVLGLVACGSETSTSTPEKTNATNASNDANTSETEVKEETEVVEVVEEESVGGSEESFYADWLSEILPSVSDESLTLQDVSYNFFVTNNTLFPTKTDADIASVKNMVDSTVTMKHLNKNATPYFEKILSYSGYVISVEEETFDDGETISHTHIMDDEGNSYIVVMFKSTGDILEDDYVQFYGAPVGIYSFENVSGGFTNTQMFFGSHIEKN